MRHINDGTFKDLNGAVVGTSTTSDGNAGTISVFLAGTTTAADVYTASSGGTAVNSVSTDAYGYFVFYVDDSEYMPSQLFKITLSHSDVRSKSYDNIRIIPDEPYKYYVDATAPDLGAATTRGDRSLKDLVDSIGTSKSASIVVSHSGSGNTTIYTLSTFIEVPENIRIIREKGAIITDDTNNATLKIYGAMNEDAFQSFDFTNGTGTVKWGDAGGGVTDPSPKIKAVKPQWWGATGDNSTNDTVGVDAAIVAGNYGNIPIHFPPGVYRVTPGQLTTITCSIDGRDAHIAAHDATEAVLLDINYETTNSELKLNTVIGSTIPKPATYATTGLSVSGIGIRIRGALYSTITVQRMLGFTAALSLPGALDDAQIADNWINIREFRSNNWHILMTAADDDSNNNVELNNFKIGYMFDGRTASIDMTSTGVALGKMQSNYFDIESMEIHQAEGDHGIIVDGALTRRNFFYTKANIYNVDSGSGGYMVYGRNGANNNVFELATWDEDGISTDATNIFRTHASGVSEQVGVDGNPVTPSGRSMTRGSAAPASTTMYYTEGDIHWNNSTSAGIRGWECTSSGVGAASIWDVIWSRPSESITAAGASSISSYGITKINTTAGAQTMTLDDPSPTTLYGLVKEFVMIADGGSDAVLTITSFESGTNTATFDTVYGYLMLVWNGNEWGVIKNIDVTLS